MPVLFSIIIPTLNEEKFLPNLLHSLTRQKKKNFEIIIIDALSEDKTKEVASIFSEKLSLRILDSQKRSIAHQRNVGAKKALGKYLIFLDADSQVYPSFTNKLEKIVKQKKGVIFLPSLFPDVSTAKNKVIFSVVNATVEASQTLGKPLPTAGVMIVEKNFFKTMNGFDESAFASEDHDFIIRAKDLGVKARFIKDIKVIFSLRRARKEGELVLLVKYIITATQIFMKGKVKKDIFKYKMGGHFFSDQVIYTKKAKKRVSLLNSFL